MMELRADKLVELMHMIDDSLLRSRGAHGPLSQAMLREAEVAANHIKSSCDAISLTVSSRSVEYVRQAKTYEAFAFGFEHVKRVIASELQGQLFYAPLSSSAKYFRQAKLFGDDVWASFPSANDDIYEAGMCLALDRYTACVMHLMRACEVGLTVLADTLHLKKENDWGSYIREIDKEIVRREKAAGARSPEEQRYAEAAASFDHLKRAWRNPTMHVDKSYSLERAEEIFQATGSFLRQLAGLGLMELVALYPE